MRPQDVGGNVAGVLILSEFTGASQSLGAGAILVNPWNITDLSAAIADALSMTEAERRERHRQNHMHISIHTSQTWAEMFINELNDTHVEAELRTKHIPPQVCGTLTLERKKSQPCWIPVYSASNKEFNFLAASRTCKEGL